jgi:hypothetical protein
MDANPALRGSALRPSWQEPVVYTKTPPPHAESFEIDIWSQILISAKMPFVAQQTPFRTDISNRQVSLL